jgi:hypothetical protein
MWAALPEYSLKIQRSWLITVGGFWFSISLPKFVMKGKFKHWWSSIPPISTKQTITSHLNWTHWTQKKDHNTYDIGNPGPGLGQAQQMWQGWTG